MLTRRFERDGTVSAAHYSPCDAYRYGLERIWNPDRAPILFVMLNPSTATERANDPTIERCERRARAMDAGGVRIANLFAWRATRPADLRRAEAPEGPGNAALLSEWSENAAMTIAAWGVHGALRGAGPAAARRLGALWHLGLTRDGHPRHPLYVPYAVAPSEWPPTDRYAVPER
ncbi:hypothetical protein ROJ8625_03476 [Roseivivax jejudonensis]|uniref:DUF1643 domain-containing protein n=1 Tax=Roseivivax jejudonensis TaxID=1529041 RepID=A0A1X7A1L8_9RHOB|nr:DUF1643 domain-containing protein [Roseivivax jejudonensis]SLN67693.1 hypothetical protein ROJ8625_03476 [Roseivivax jejudonensis]